VLPLCFMNGESAESLGLDGTETFDIQLPNPIEPRTEVPVVAKKTDGKEIRFTTVCRIDTPIEVDYYRNGGILQTVIRRKLNESRQMAGV
jgi:aconitate hydratase